MANVLSPEKQEQIRALGRLGWSLRRIEEATGVRRETVGRYLRWAGNLAASTMESSVEAALATLLGNGELPLADRVKERVSPPEETEVPEIAAGEVDLGDFDSLLEEPRGDALEVPA